MMEIFSSVWPARRKVHTVPLPIQDFIDKYGLQPQDVGHFDYMLTNYDPLRLSVEHYATRNCYEHPSIQQGWYERQAAAGLLESDNGVDYQLTEKGRECFNALYALMNPRWDMPTLSEDEVDRLLGLMGKVVDATIDAPEPPTHWSTTTRAHAAMKAPAGTHPREGIVARTFDLWAYRDDVHLAAWKHHLVPANTWEALTYLWNGKANSAETLAEALKDHGYGVADYVNSISQLIGRGWVEPADDGTVHITDEGRRIRDEAERQTDDWFYAAFDVLTDEELNELRALLSKELAGLQALLS